MTMRTEVHGWHPARTRGVLATVALGSLLAGTTLLFVAPAAAAPWFAIAFAASAVVAGADSRDRGPRR
jgi:hypothetical protein